MLAFNPTGGHPITGKCSANKERTAFRYKLNPLTLGFKLLLDLSSDAQRPQ